jgi:hypothetical protein
MHRMYRAHAHRTGLSNTRSAEIYGVAFSCSASRSFSVIFLLRNAPEKF